MSTELVKADENTLLTLLSEDKIAELRKAQNYLSIVNAEPRKEWVKAHPMVKKNGKGLPYLPIERCEWLMQKLFEDVEYEIQREGLLANSVYVAVRVWYTNPVTGKRLHQDGVGAIDVQTKAGASPTDFTQIVSGALNRNLPTAESYARKNAMQKIGKIFGGRLDSDIETAASNMFLNIQDNAKKKVQLVDTELGGSETEKKEQANGINQ
jgi:hypothetical protein